MKFLIVEDICMVRKLLQRLLTPLGECVSAENGKEALLLFNHAWLKEERFDAIFLDLMMPEVSGDQVLKEIRQMENKLGVDPDDQTKIVIVTALHDPQNVINAIKNECDAYITKPFDKKIIYETVNKLGLMETNES